VFGTLGAPSYVPLWPVAGCGTSAAGRGLFSASYLVSHRTDSAILVQLVGAAFFLPMFLGGLLGGVIADRFDRRRVLTRSARRDRHRRSVDRRRHPRGHRAAMAYVPAMVLLGTGSVTDFTCRRALIHEPGRAPRC